MSAPACFGRSNHHPPQGGGGRLYSRLNSIGFRVYGLPSELKSGLVICRGCGEHASRGSDFVG